MFVVLATEWSDFLNPATVAGTVAMLLAIGTYIRGNSEHKLAARKDALESLTEEVSTLKVAIEKCEEHRQNEVREKNDILFSYWKISEENRAFKSQPQPPFKGGLM